MGFADFKELLKKDSELQKAFSDELGQRKFATQDEAIDALLAFAREHGCEITPEEEILMKADQHELDENELETVAGGFCVFTPTSEEVCIIPGEGYCLTILNCDTFMTKFW